ncbi:hypothetical protein [Bradyrhizobium elkanii]|uniref:hypothetical protein n=1 Tax=Bradyrhizobium elkanii TaxID=29448 RepID=UPI00114D05BC|nr:hypothetical protein [Bradyrhizobium elkanii]
MKPYDRIMIGQTICVVAGVYDDGSIEVVHTPAKPSNDDAFWNSENWEFSPGASGYADKYARLSPFVSALKRGH